MWRALHERNVPLFFYFLSYGFSSSNYSIKAWKLTDFLRSVFQTWAQSGSPRGIKHKAGIKGKMQRSVFSTGAASAVPRRVSDRAVQTDLQRKTRLQAFWKNLVLTEPMISLTLFFFFFPKGALSEKDRNILNIPTTNQARFQKYFTSE